MLSRDLYSYYAFENVSSIIDQKKLKKICENDRYIIYRYKEKESSEEYIIGKKKSSPKKYFKCSDSYDLVSLLNDSLFLCNSTGEIGRDTTYVYRLDFSKKIIETYNLRSDFGKMVVRGEYGRYYTTEEFKDMNVINNELVIFGHREKSDDEKFADNPENKDTDFEIVFEIAMDNSYVPYYIEDKEKYSFKDDIIVSKGKPDKSDDPIRGLATVFGCLMALICAIIGLIGSIVTHFKTPIWIGVLAAGIISFIILFRLVIKRLS